MKDMCMHLPCLLDKLVQRRLTRDIVLLLGHRGRHHRGWGPRHIGVYSCERLSLENLLWEHAEVHLLLGLHKSHLLLRLVRLLD